jgi:hypothetical protein
MSDNYVVYPYYKLFKANLDNLIGLVGAQVLIQKKYDDSKTVAITYDNIQNKLLIGNKRKLDISLPSEIKIDEDFFKYYTNWLFYGTILNKRIVLWDVWDKYNCRFLDNSKIIKYRAKEYYNGTFSLDIYNNYSSDYIYRFKSPLLTYYV